MQTSHGTDLLVAAVAGQDWPSLLRLGRWMDDGEDDIVRVNACGIVAKSRDTDLVDQVPGLLSRDVAVRRRYMAAFTARAGTSVTSLRRELGNQRDAGARWCSAVLLGRDGSPSAQAALLGALRREPQREHVRAIGLILQGEHPCV